MKRDPFITGFATLLVLSMLGCALPHSLERSDTTTALGLSRATAGGSAQLLSVFFGLDNTLPQAANAICRGAAGLDGMPVVFSTEIDHTTLQALEQGPTLVLAERFDPTHPHKGLDVRRTRGSACPVEGTLQAVRVVWSGGVTLANGNEPGAAERGLYRVTVRAQDGSLRVVAPTALADLGDGDNNHLLCLDTTDRPVSVAFPAGVFTDPNDDLNPATSVELTPEP